MKIFRTLYRIILESLFPLSRAEKELFSFTPEQALRELPKAPKAPYPDMSSVFAYKDERVSNMIWNIKYKKSKQAVAIGGYALFEEVAPQKRCHLLELVIVPIPITARRRRERGFNQCELLVDEMKRLDIDGQLLVAKDLLIRVQHKDRQTLKDREERLAGAKGIFAVNPEIGSRGYGRPIIVIDDVITTGSTMREALETLRKAGFEDVKGLSLAH